MKTMNGTISADHKVKEGKLLRCVLKINQGIILSIKITGDFFMYPEEGIEKLENMLTGLQYNEDQLRSKIFEFFNSNIQVVGANAEDFLTLLLKAN